MSLLRWSSLGLILGLVLSVTPSCGASASACGPGSCNGCCDVSGQCLGGLELTACGSNGAACNACGTSQVCQVGSCVLDPALADAGTTNQAPTNPLAFFAVITPNPAIVGTNAMDVVITGANGVRVIGATMTAKTFMPAMGHGSPNPTVTEVGDGQYKVSGVKFTMAGTWTVTLTATAPNGLSGSQVFSYSTN